MANSVFIWPGMFTANGTTINPVLPVAFPDGSAAAPSITFANSLASGVYRFGADDIGVTLAATARFRFATDIGGSVSGLIVHADTVLAWGASGVTGSDTFVRRDTANTLARRNGATSQVDNHYGRYVSATNFNRLAIAHAVTTLSNVSGATVTATGLIPDGAVVVGVSTTVTTGLGTGGGTNGYQVGDAGDPNRWGAVVGTAAGTDTDNTDWTTTTIQLFTSATDVIITADGGSFNGTGVIVVNVDYLIGQAD